MEGINDFCMFYYVGSYTIDKDTLDNQYNIRFDRKKDDIIYLYRDICNISY